MRFVILRSVLCVILLAGVRAYRKLHEESESSETVRDSSDTVRFDSSDTVRDSSDSSEEIKESSDKKSADPTSDGFDSSGVSSPRNCDGRGTRYCDETKYAVFETTCPKICLECEEGSETSKIKALVKNKMYDFVYVTDYGICLANCKDRHRSSCGNFEEHKGFKYCKYLRCESGGIDGCHSPSDFGVPSCRDCASAFPNACNRDLSEHDAVEADSSEPTEEFWDKFVAYQRTYNSTYNHTSPGVLYNATGPIRVRVINGTLERNLTVLVP
jgi:hypothetical protein